MDRHLGYDRYQAEIISQSDLLAALVLGADLAAPVPACPGWNLAHLVRHVGGAHRWGETVVRTRASEPVPHDALDDVSDDTDEDPAALADWLRRGAARFAETLRATDPATAVWSMVPDRNHPLFWARRMTHETVVHHSDAAAALGADQTVDPVVAADGLDEWMYLGTLPQAFGSETAQRALMAPGRALYFRASDAPAEVGAGWLVDLGGERVTWRRVPGDHAVPGDRAAHDGQGRDLEGNATVVVRGPLTDLLLLMYQRRSAREPPMELRGDGELFDAWLRGVSHWLRK